MLPRRIHLIGLENSGKTALSHRLAKNEFILTESTVGLEFHSIVYQNTKFQIWDTSGEKRFFRLLLSFLRAADTILLVIDPHTYDDEKNARILALLQEVPENAQIHLVFTKDDLIDRSNRQIVEPIKTQIEHIVKEYVGNKIISISAKTETDKQIFDKLKSIMNFEIVLEKALETESPNHIQPAIEAISAYADRKLFPVYFLRLFGDAKTHIGPAHLDRARFVKKLMDRFTPDAAKDLLELQKKLFFEDAPFSNSDLENADGSIHIPSKEETHFLTTMHNRPKIPETLTTEEERVEFLRKKSGYFRALENALATLSPAPRPQFMV